MSYYPAERDRRGGCMESISRWCRTAYVYPLDTRKLLYAGGAVVGIILIAVIWSGLSSSDSAPHVEPFKGSKVLRETPLVVGSNFFPVNLRDLVQNNIYKIQFDHNLSNDTVFGNANCTSCQTDIPRLQSGLVGSQIWSLRVPCDAKYKDAVALTLEQVDAMSRLLSHYPDNATFVRSSTDLSEGFKANRLGGLLAVTSGHSFDGRMSVLRTLYSLGVRVMALTSNCSTAWAASYNDTDFSQGGLSDFGVAVVKEMNRLGMVIDLSEASLETQLDVLNTTKAPVVFTRAAAIGVTNVTRNINDDVLQKLKENKGLAMITFVAQYLNINASNASISDVKKHINYVKNLTGVDNVGIGAEFDDKETYPASLSDVSKFPILFDELGNDNWSENDLKKLAGQNFLRVLQEVEKVAKDLALSQADESFTLQYNSACYSDYDSRLKPANSSSSLTSNPSTATVTSSVTTANATKTSSPTTPSLTTPIPTPTPSSAPTTQSTVTTVNATTPSSTTGIPTKSIV